MDQKGSKLSKLSNLRICRGECPFECFHKNNQKESRIKRWLIHSIMPCSSKNDRLILQFADQVCPDRTENQYRFSIRPATRKISTN